MFFYSVASEPYIWEVSKRPASWFGEMTTSAKVNDNNSFNVLTGLLLRTEQSLDNVIKHALSMRSY